jgi:hypothetical protein
MHVNLASIKHQIPQNLLLLLINFSKAFVVPKNAIIAWLEGLILSSLIIDRD